MAAYDFTENRSDQSPIGLSTASGSTFEIQSNSFAAIGTIPNSSGSLFFETSVGNPPIHKVNLFGKGTYL